MKPCPVPTPLLAVGAYALARLSAQTAKTGEIEAGERFTPALSRAEEVASIH